MLEQLLSLPGFVYDLGGKYFFLGKWICKECTDVDATDCAYMYAMSREAQEEKESSYYFQKLRAYSDFALEVPYDPVRIRKNMEALLETLPEAVSRKLESQISAFSKDLSKYA
ncbi:MAG: hypothetical protein Q4C52_08340 [Eubacteriales bacterium]|nr:hypothetical protein [Eubacteriales bacterium]